MALVVNNTHWTRPLRTPPRRQAHLLDENQPFFAGCVGPPFCSSPPDAAAAAALAAAAAAAAAFNLVAPPPALSSAPSLL